jgi:hypothetical protein
MDPTLAPGYVPPNASKEKPAKGHHWAEIQKTRTRNSTNHSDKDMVDGVTDKSDSSTVTSPRTPVTKPSAPRPHTANNSKPRHPRMASWLGGRSTLSDGEGIGGPADLEEVPVGVKRQAVRLEDYTFPEHRLRTVMDGMLSNDSL